MSDSDNTAHETSSTAEQQHRKRLRIRWLLGLVVLFLVLGLAYGAYWFFIARFYIATEDAYVHGNRVAVMARVQGSVTRIAADDTDYVERGQSLLELDESDARVVLDQAKANLAQTVREVKTLYVQTRQQQAVIDQRQATSDQAQRDFARAEALYKRNSVSQERFQQARTQAQNAQAGLREARHQLESLQAQTQGTDPAHHPRVVAAAQRLRQAWLNLEYTTVQAPVSGHIAQRSVQLGQQVSPGKPLLSIVPLEQIWVEANFKETDLKRVRIGQPVEIHADFYGDDTTYDGTVVGLSAGTGSAFELLPPQNASGNWIKVVQRVPVRIALKPEQIETHPLRIGLSLTATIDTHDLGGLRLTRQPRIDTRYSTAIYDTNRTALDELIDTIVQRNITASETSPASTDSADGR